MTGAHSSSGTGHVAAGESGVPESRETSLPRAAVPTLLYVPATIGALLLLLPLLALVIKADWPNLPAAVVSPEALSALSLSLKCGVAATLVCLVFGVPMAMVMARREGPAVRLLRVLVTLPLVLPPLVGGIALLYLLSKFGLLGKYLFGWFGIAIPFTTTAVVISEAFVALPFLVLSLEGSLRTAGTRYDVVAATLGARRWTVLWRVTLPLVRPGLTSATVLCFARALGEFGATALFAGNRPDVTRTMPLLIYTAFNGSGADQNTAIALSLLLVLVAGVILVLVRPWRVSGVG